MEELARFAEDPANWGEVPEDGLTQRLCRQLVVAAHGLPFQFLQQALEDETSGRSPSTDLGVVGATGPITIGATTFHAGEFFFKLEAKRLPTPGKGREREYLVGGDRPSGGVERFKCGIHGRGLNRVGMLGYLQSGGFAEWFDRINGWVNDLTEQDDSMWSADDTLVEVVVDSRVAQYRSHNLRVKDDEVDTLSMVHLWVLLREAPASVDDIEG